MNGLGGRGTHDGSRSRLRMARRSEDALVYAVRGRGLMSSSSGNSEEEIDREAISGGELSCG